jgi:hypothetical protein
MSEFLNSVVLRLAATARAIDAVTRDLSREEVTWKPDPARWSVLEVVNHLGDEEAEDFRTRLDIALHRPAEPFPPIDPQGWVRSRDYAARRLGESLDRFLAERDRSLTWLKGLGEIDLDRGKSHPTGGSLTARQLLAAWAAHDLVHLRQVTKLRYDFLASEVAPTTLDYAGKW